MENSFSLREKLRTRGSKGLSAFVCCPLTLPSPAEEGLSHQHRGEEMNDYIAVAAADLYHRPSSNFLDENRPMKKQSRHPIMGAIIYGLLVIVPLAVVFLLLVKLTEILEKISAPLGLESSLGTAI